MAREKKKKGCLGRILSVFLFLILVGAAISLLGGSSSSSPSSTQNKTSSVSSSSNTLRESTPEPVIEYSTVSLNSIISELKNNAMKAKETYEGKYLEITGKLSTIDASGKYISLQPVDVDFSFDSISCYLQNDEQRNQVSMMHSGDTVTLRGKCKSVGEVLGYSLNVDSIDGFQGVPQAKSTTDGYIVCTADELDSVLNDNALLAKNQYKGQQVAVTGILSNIDASGKYIDIKPINTQFSLTTIQCYIKTEEVKQAVFNLSVGQTITVYGVCKDVGEILGFSIDISSIS